MARVRAIPVLLAGGILSGCATVPRQCEIPDQTSYAFNGTTVTAPEGCRFVGGESGAVRTLSCEDGRQGLAIADVAGVSIPPGS